MGWLLRSGKVWCVAVAGVWLACLPAAVAKVPRSASSTADSPARLAGNDARLERVIALTEQSNVPKLIGHERWRELLATYRPTIEPTGSHRTFADAVNALTEASGISHFHYYTSDDWFYWHLCSTFGPGSADAKVAHIGLFPQRIGLRWFVRGVLEGSVAASTDIRVGDELLSVDGRPFEPIASFRGTEGRPVRLRIRRKPELIYNIKVIPVMESLHEALQRAVLESVRVVEHQGYKYAYLHGWSMLGAAEEYWKLLDMQDDVDGLLLDYRDGIGGYAGRGRGFLFGPLGEHRHWIKPTVILIADGTRSAKEVLVNEAQRRGRAVLVGTPTPGDVTTVAAVRRVGEDGLLMLPGERHELEGKPTMPDHLVERDIRFCAGADPQVCRAKEVLAELIRNSHDVPQEAPTGAQ